MAKLRNFLTCGFDSQSSSSKKYHDANGNEVDENICFLVFDENMQMDYQGAAFSSDYAVLSRKVAQKLRACKNQEEAMSFLGDCVIEVNDEGKELQFAVRMPSQATSLFGAMHF